MYWWFPSFTGFIINSYFLSDYFFPPQKIQEVIFAKQESFPLFN